MGLCVNIFGIPILEDRRCRQARLDEREARQAQRQQARGGRVETRQEERTERVVTRQGGRTERSEQQTLRTALRTAPGATVPAAEAIGETGPVASALGLGLGGLGRDGQGNAQIGVIPLVIGGVVVALAFGLGSQGRPRAKKR